MKVRKRVKEAVRSLFLGVQRPFFEELLVLGDSHVRVFSSPRLRRQLWRYHLNVVSVHGATASGLENPNSKTQTYNIFNSVLAATRAQKVVVMLGEVDTGFVIWYRADKYGVPVGEAFTKTVSTYQSFLRTLKARGFSPVCVSAPLPTIQDGNTWGEVANERKSITATQRQRTELTLAFNRELEAFCRVHTIPYINLDAASLGPDGLVRAELLNKNPSDHHYEKRVYARVLAQHVGQVIPQAGRARASARPFRYRTE